jgi:hypothetical protein
MKKGNALVYTVIFEGVVLMGKAGYSILEKLFRK